MVMVLTSCACERDHDLSDLIDIFIGQQLDLWWHAILMTFEWLHQDNSSVFFFVSFLGKKENKMYVNLRY